MNRHQVITGLVVAGIGLALLANRFLEPRVAIMQSWWPLVLIVMGAARLSNPSAHDRNRQKCIRSGAWLLFVGVWGLVSEARWFGLSYQTSWPLLVIAAGVLLVWRSLEASGAFAGRGE